MPANEALDPGGNDSAFDADADIAYALLMACSLNCFAIASISLVKTIFSGVYQGR